jgi:hypothetical protein
MRERIEKGAPEAADRLALFILSEPGQAVLAKWGFVSVGR